MLFTVARALSDVSPPPQFYGAVSGGTLRKTAGRDCLTGPDWKSAVLVE